MTHDTINLMDLSLHKIEKYFNNINNSGDGSIFNYYKKFIYNCLYKICNFILKNKTIVNSFTIVDNTSAMLLKLQFNFDFYNIKMNFMEDYYRLFENNDYRLKIIYTLTKNDCEVIKTHYKSIINDYFNEINLLLGELLELTKNH